MLDAWPEFDWIAEEQHLIEEGIKDGSDFGEAVATALRKVPGYAAE